MKLNLGAATVTEPAAGAEEMTEQTPAEENQTGGEPVAEPLEEEGGEPGGEEGTRTEEGGEQGEPGGQTQPQTAQQNHENAARRREQEMFRSLMGGLVNPDTGKPFANPAEWTAWRRAAEQARQAEEAGITPEQLTQLQQDAVDAFKANDPEFQQMQQQLARQQATLNEQTWKQDLAAIKAAYPDEQAKHVKELGPEFWAIMATGQVSAVAAYEAVRAEKKRSTPDLPSTGDLGGGAAKKTFYTKDEVDRMSQDEVDKNLDTILESMKRWS